MKIRTQLNLHSVALALALMLLSGGVLVAVLNVNNTRAAAENMQFISRETSEVNILVLEYVLRPTARVERQLRGFTSSPPAVRLDLFTGAEAHEAAKLAALKLRVRDLIDTALLAEDGPDETTRRYLIGQLLSEIQNALGVVGRIDRMLGERFADEARFLTVIALIAFVTPIIAALFTWFVVLPSIFRPLEAVHDAVVNPAPGKLTKAAGTYAGNEIGTVAIALDEMKTGLESARSELTCKNAELSQKVDQLAASNRDLQDFAYIASHDLKEPLRGIHNHAGFLMEDCADKLGPDDVRRINRMQVLTKKMETLISDLLHFSRLSNKPPEDAVSSPSEVILEIRERLADLLEEQRVELTVAEDLPPVHLNRSHLTTVFENLITNAARYNDKEQKRIEIGFLPRLQEDGKIHENVFHVSDNGIGIDPEYHQDVFRMFRRLNTEDSFGKGTGAGLAFVSRIINASGGKIWVESKKGQGATFYFTLMLAELEQRHAA